MVTKLSVPQIVVKILLDYAASLGSRRNELFFKEGSIGIDQVAETLPVPFLLVKEMESENDPTIVCSDGVNETRIGIVVLGESRSSVDRLCALAAKIAVEGYRSEDGSVHIEGLDDLAEDDDSIIIGSTDPETIINEAVSIREDDKLTKQYPQRSQRTFTVFSEPEDFTN